MKNIVLILLSFFTLSEAYSQENKKWWLGGKVSGAYETNRFNNDMTTQEWSIGPEIGLRFENGFATGININLNQVNREWIRNNGTNYKATSIETSAFLRYYLSDGEKLKFFGQLDLGYSYSEVFSNNPMGIIHGISAKIQPGIQYSLNNNWALQSTFGKVGYDYTKSETSPNTSSNFGIDLSLSSLTIGVLFNF